MTLLPPGTSRRVDFRRLASRRVATWSLQLTFLALLVGVGHANRVPGWTLLVYIHDDCDPAPSGRLVSVLEHFARAGGAEGVEVLAFADQFASQTVSSIPVLNQPAWSGGKLFRVGRNRLDELASFPTEPDMGDPDTLVWALTKTLEHSHGSRLGVWSISHGRPWRGLLADRTNANEGLSFKGMAQALRTVSRASGQRVDLLGLISCGTAGAEALSELAGEARWILASEDQTEEASVPPAYVLERLAEEPTMLPEALARLCVHAYNVSDPLQGGDSEGIAMFDSCEMPGFLQAVDEALAPLLPRLRAGDNALRCSLLACRPGEITFACGLSGCMGEDADGNHCTVSRCCLVDVLGVCKRLIQQADPELQRAGRLVQSAHRRLVPLRKADVNHAAHGGLSIFMPCRKAELTPYLVSQVAKNSSWDELLIELADTSCVDCCRPMELRCKDVRTPLGGNPPSMSVTGTVAGVTERPIEGWVLVFPVDAQQPLLSIAADDFRVEGDHVRIGATWDLRIWCLEGPAGRLPLPVLFPRVGEALPLWAFGELPLDWYPPEAPEPFAPVPVFARYAISTAPGAAEGRLLGLRPRNTREGDSVFGIIPLKRGGALRGVARAADLWAKSAESLAPSGFAPVGGKLSVISVPQPMVPWRPNDAMRVQVGFAVRDRVGQLYVGRDPTPIDVPGG